MSKPSSGYFVAWLCLLSFGLGSLFAQDRLIVCTGPDGTTRIELSCPSDAPGCPDAVASAGRTARRPCTDRSLNIGLGQVQASARPIVLIAPTMWTRMERWHPPVRLASPGQTLPRLRGHPPDETLSLRATVLLL